MIHACLDRLGACPRGFARRAVDASWLLGRTPLKFTEHRQTSQAALRVAPGPATPDAHRCIRAGPTLRWRRHWDSPESAPERTSRRCRYVSRPPHQKTYRNTVVSFVSRFASTRDPTRWSWARRMPLDLCGGRTKHCHWRSSSARQGIVRSSPARIWHG